MGIPNAARHAVVHRPKQITNTLSSVDLRGDREDADEDEELVEVAEELVEVECAASSSR